MERFKEIERSIITTYRKDIYSKFTKAIRDYQLINEGDRVMVCISGGKDSFLLAKCIEELHKHGKVKFDVKYVSMNPGYTDENLELIKSNAKLMNIDLEIFNSDIFDVANKLNPVNPCYLCARQRRGHLYAKAQELGCNKIALGHHFDDVIETTLLSMFYGAELKTMMPKLHSDNFEGIELIRPLYYVKEKSIIAWRDYNKLRFLNCACKFTQRTDQENQGKRKEIKKLISDLRNTYKDIDENIFNSLKNVNMSCILAWHKDKEYHTFLDDYDK